MVAIGHSRKSILVNTWRFAAFLARAIPKLFGQAAFECPICGRNGRMLAFGNPPRYNAFCPRCGALERHRQLVLWLDRNEEVVVGKTVLHFAPEQLIGEFLKSRAAQYTSGDFVAGRAEMQLNIEQIALPDACTDLVVCSHILEHVNDEKALGELFRILHPGGYALLMFPIIEAWGRTLEAADLPEKVVTDRDRERYFGQHDHIRYYGRDVRERIRNAGFNLDEVVALEPEVSRYALLRGETIFVARKPN